MCREGELTFPDLFNSYVNELVVELSRTTVGLRLNDMVLTICETYANKHDLIYNAKKTEMVVFRSVRGSENVPEIRFNGLPVKIVERFNYLGHIVTYV